MSISKEHKAAVIQEFRRKEGDAGSPEVQIAILTKRIEALTVHLQDRKKDHAGRRGLLMMVSRRRKLLDYLRRENPAGYQEIIKRLSIRK